MILSVAGHRPDKLGGYSGPKAEKYKQFYQEKIRSFLLDKRPEYTITGMALGVDQWFAQCCIDLNIPFIAAIPCHGQKNAWPEHAQKEWDRIIKYAKQEFYVTPGPYNPACMQIRNQWMVDNSNHLLAIWNGSKGGTFNCIKYAAPRLGRENITHLWENSFVPG